MLLKLVRNHSFETFVYLGLISSDFVLFEIVWRPLLIALRIIGSSEILLVNSYNLYFLLTEQPKITTLSL